MNLINVMKKQWDRTAAVVLTLLGVLALFVGYVRVADSVVLAEQTRFIVSGGIAGLFLLGLGATLWISADLRDEWRKLDRIETALGDGVLRWSDEPVSGASASGARTASSIGPGSPVNGTSPATAGNTNPTAALPDLAHAASSRDHA